MRQSLKRITSGTSTALVDALGNLPRPSGTTKQTNAVSSELKVKSLNPDLQNHNSIQHQPSVKRRHWKSVLATAQTAALSDTHLRSLVGDSKAIATAGPLSPPHRSASRRVKHFEYPSTYDLQRHMRNVDAFAALLALGDLDKGLQLFSFVQTSPKGHKNKQQEVKQASFSIIASSEIKNRLEEAISALEELSDTHTLGALFRLLKPHITSGGGAGDGFIHAQPFLRLHPYHQRLLCCKCVDALLAATAKDSFEGVTNVRGPVIPGGKQADGLQKDFHHIRLELLAEAAEGLPLTPFTRHWLDAHYRKIPTSLSEHKNAVRIANRVYRTQILQSKLAEGRSLSDKNEENTKSSSAHPLYGQRVLATATPQQLKAIVQRFEVAVVSALRLLGPHSQHSAKVRQLHLRMAGQPLLALLYLRDIEGATRLMDILCGLHVSKPDVAVMRSSSFYKSNRSVAQRAAHTAVLADAKASAIRGRSLQHRFLQKLFNQKQRHPSSLASATNKRELSMLRQVTGRSPQLLSHDVHLQFMAVEHQQNNNKSNDRRPDDRNNIIDAHFIATFRSLVTQRRDATACVNLAIASSVVSQSRRPLWSKDKALLDAVVSATCRELERFGAHRAPNRMNSVVGSFEDRSITDPHHPFHLAFQQNADANEGTIATRSHISLKGFAQHLLTKSSRFPNIEDWQRVALMVSLLNAGNKAGIVRKGLEVPSGRSTLPPRQQKWLWNISVLLSNHAWHIKKKKNKDKGLFPKNSFALQSPSSAQTDVLTPNNAGLVSLWRLLHRSRESSSSSTPPMSSLLPLVLRLYMEGPHEHHQEHSVRRQFWDSRLPKDSVDALLMPLAEGITGPSDFVNSDDNKNTEKATESSGTSEAAVERRAALTALATIFDDEEAFRAVLRQYLYNTNVPQTLRDRCEILLKAEGAT